MTSKKWPLASKIVRAASSKDLLEFKFFLSPAIIYSSNTNNLERSSEIIFLPSVPQSCVSLLALYLLAEFICTLRMLFEVALSFAGLLAVCFLFSKLTRPLFRYMNIPSSIQVPLFGSDLI